MVLDEAAVEVVLDKNRVIRNRLGTLVPDGYFECFFED